MQQRVQFATLLQFGEHGSADLATTEAICPGTDRRDLEMALEHLVAQGSIEGPPRRLSSLVALAAGGHLALTALGRLRLDVDDV